MKRSRYTTGLIGTAVCLLFANSTAAQQSTLPTGVHPVSPREGMAVSDPEQLLERTPGHLVQDMHAAFGVHHARAVHSKGTILQGWFEPERAASALSSASLFRARVPVIVRFSDFTGIPDTERHAQPRGLAVKFLLPDGSALWSLCLGLLDRWSVEGDGWSRTNRAKPQRPRTRFRAHRSPSISLRHCASLRG